MLFRIAIAIAAAAVPTLAAANSLVVGAQGPSAETYRVGARYPNGQQIRLAAGDRLSIVDNGSLRQLRGPGTFTVGTAVPAERRSVLKTLIRDGVTRRSRPGAVRGGTAEEASEGPRRNIWLVDADRDSGACYVPGGQLAIWRRGAAPGESFTFLDATGQSLGAATVPSNRRRAAVEAMPAGAALLETAAGRRIALVPVTIGEGAEEEQVTALAAAFIAAGCTAQADALVGLLGEAS